jgi:hypothetical protein
VRTARIEDIAEVEKNAADMTTIYLRELTAYNEGVKTLQAKAFLMYRTEEKTATFKVLVQSSKGSSNFRIDVSDFVFNKPLVSVIKREEDVLAVIYIKKNYYSLHYEDLDFSKMTGFPIPKELLVSSLLGKVFIYEEQKDISSPQDHALLIIGDDGQETIHLNSDFQPVKVQYLFSSDAFLVTFSKFQSHENLSFPKKITLENEQGTLEINYTNISLNSAIADQAFSVDATLLENFSEVQ